MEDKKEPTGFTLRVKQLSKIGNADATVNIQINELDGNLCELTFDGKAKLSGTLARTGQRVLGGVANTLTKQFFAALEEEVASVNSGQDIEENTREAIKKGAPVMQAKTMKTPVEEPQSFNLWEWIKSFFGIN